MGCYCRIRNTAREYGRIIKQLPEADQKWMETFYDNYCNDIMDANINKAIIEGSWPNSDEIIAHMRKKEEEANGN